ncbi:MAG: iron-sulfur cluster assembly scaffold protein [Sphingomonadaceae bacterium]|nr:iron-sulfur cluster assembly scaffold protein [Sphingomonadaceae bacterium]
MNGNLYSPEILRLAMIAGAHPRLLAPDASISARTPVCGSAITTDIKMDDAGLVEQVGFDLSACAFGQAAAGLFAQGAIGRSAEQLALAAEGLAAWLAGYRAVPPDWPEVEALVPARQRSARHEAILLAFRSGASAAQRAMLGRS